MDTDASSTDRSIGSLVAPGSVGAISKGKRLLVPLDGSRLAEMALPHAARLAQATASDIRLLQVVTPFVIYGSLEIGVLTTPSAWDACAEEPVRAREYLHGIADMLRKQGISADTIVLEGNTARAIVEYTKHHPEVHMIAMATHGRSGIRRWILGSVAETVLHASPVPVLLVRAEVTFSSVAEGLLDPVASAVPTAPEREEPWYPTVMVPLDGSRFAEQALEDAQALAARFGATLLLVSVVPPLEHVESTGEAADIPLRTDNAENAQAATTIRYLSGVAERLREKGHKVQQEVVSGNPAEEILSMSEAGKGDLIVMASHGRSGLQRLWLGSVAMKVVHAAKVPVLLLRVSEIAERPADKKHAAAPLV